MLCNNCENTCERCGNPTGCKHKWVHGTAGELCCFCGVLKAPMYPVHDQWSIAEDERFGEF